MGTAINGLMRDSIQNLSTKPVKMYSTAHARHKVTHLLKFTSSFDTMPFTSLVRYRHIVSVRATAFSLSATNKVTDTAPPICARQEERAHPSTGQRGGAGWLGSSAAHLGVCSLSARNHEDIAAEGADPGRDLHRLQSGAGTDRVAGRVPHDLPHLQQRSQVRGQGSRQDRGHGRTQVTFMAGHRSRSRQDTGYGHDRTQVTVTAGHDRNSGLEYNRPKV